LCTHIIYSFGKVTRDKAGWTIAPYEVDFDIKQGYPTLNTILKKRDPKLKTLLAIGGWNHGSEGFKQMVASVESRRYFIEKSKEFIIKHGESFYNIVVVKKVC
ncbi:MAG: glycosyl hydrolase family 18 protein, partial [Cyanobacteria bacterium J06649_11]